MTAAGPLVEETLRLLRAWARDEVPPPSPVRGLDLLAFARERQVSWPVCTALSRVLPPPAAALLTAPALDERRRAAETLAAQLADLAERLARAGVRPVALKGAAEIAAAGGAAPWRQMIDLDLLVTPETLPAARRALEAAGYAADADAFVPTDYHFPAFMPPPGRGLAWVELHTRPGWSRRGPLVGMESRARPSAMPGLRIPAPQDRALHLVLHSQIADRRFARRTLRLRDALDWRSIVVGEGLDQAVLAARMEEAGAGDAFRAFAALAARVWDEPAPEDWAARWEAWAEDALAALADPRIEARRMRADRAAGMAAALTTRETLLHALRGTVHPPRLRRFLRRLRP